MKSNSPAYGPDEGMYNDLQSKTVTGENIRVTNDEIQTPSRI